MLTMFKQLEILRIENQVLEPSQLFVGGFMSKKQISTVLGIAIAIWLGTTVLPRYIPLGRK